MGERDTTGNSPIRSPFGRFLQYGRRHVLRVGFTAAMVVITLAGTYAVYGASSDRSLDTNGRTGGHHSQQLQLEGGAAAPQNQEGTMPTTGANASGTDPAPQPSVQSGDASNQSHSTTNVTINGQQVEVPANGEIHRTIDNGNGQTDIHVRSSHTSTNSGDSNSSSSSVNLNVTSESHSSSQ